MLIISHEDRLIYEAILKERQLLSNPNVEIPYTYQKNDIISIDIKKMYIEHKKELDEIKKQNMGNI